jgi:NADP-dependent 3-hydroxy acid dehydrogenase YdfG
MSTPTTEPRVALVSGASSGFGLATSVRLAASGHRVFGTSRSGAAAAPGVAMLALDVDHDASVQACIARLLQSAGRLDIVVNNAGRAMLGACEETSAVEARALFETNVFGTMRVVAAVLPVMRAQRRGTIVNVGSLSGFVGVPFHGVYAATKHALAGYTEALRFEVEAFGVRVALIEPAAHRTAIQMLEPQRPFAHYDVARRRVAAIIQGQIDAGDSPERVVDVIVEAATSAAPRLRYRIGRKAKLAAWARRWLPAWWLEHWLRREFQLDR